MRRFRLIYEEDGYPRELARDADRLQAIRDGHLTADTPVTIYRDGAKPEASRAGDVEELKGAFEPAPPPPEEQGSPLPPAAAPAAPQPPSAEVGDRPPEPEPAAARPQPESESEQVQAADPEPSADAGQAEVQGSVRLLVGLGIAAALLVLIIVAIARSGLGPTTASVPVRVPAPAAPANEVAAVDDAEPLSEGTIQEWQASGATHRFRVGDLAIGLSSQPGEGDLPVPVLTASAPGLGEGRLTGVAGFSDASARFVVLRPNRRDARPSVMLMTFSGGAHCCTSIKLLTPAGSGWQTADFGSWDGEGFSEAPRDVDGDGLVDFMMPDNRFLYSFTSYAESYAPTRIFNLVGGRFEDVSAAARYAAVHRQDMQTSWQSCMQRNNGACAAYAASAARVGELQAALETIAPSYNPNFSWDLPGRCAVSRRDGACPAGQEIRPPDYLVALQWFLEDNGYARAGAALPPGGSAPPAASGDPAPTIPVQFRGIWAGSPRDCRDPAYRYSVSATGMTLPESTARVQQVTSATGNRIRMLLALEGEGSTWTSGFSIELDGERAIFDDGQGFRETLIRC